MAVRFTENTVRPNPMPGQRVQAADFSGGETIGRAVEQFGGAIADYAKVKDQIDLIRDETQAKRADTASLPEIAEIKAKYLSTEGLQAANARQQAEQEIQQIRQRHLETLGSDRARDMFEQSFTRRTAGDVAEIQSHEVRQLLAARKSEADARRVGYMNAAADSYPNPEAFRENADTAVSELRTMYPGAGEEFIRQKQAEIRSSIHVMVVERIMTDPENVLDAEQWVRDNAAEILPADETKLREKLQPHLEEIESDADFGRVQAQLAGTSSASDREEQLPEETPEPQPADREQRRESASRLADPLRGKGRGTAPGGEFGAPRTRGGKREHHGRDLAAPEGTPIYPPMEGKVKGDPFFDERFGGGWSIRIEHPNGRVTGYAHMRSRPALKAGDRVDVNTVIGSVGHSGTSDGANHLHYTIEDNGRKVDPRTVSWERNDADLPSYTPERNDIKSLYAAARQVAIRENWSPRRYERALRRIDEQASREDRLYARQQQDLTEAAWQKVAETGPENITSINQVPGFASLPANEKMQVLNLIKQNKKGEVEAGGDTYFQLFEASVDPAQQEGFASINLDAVPDIKPEERRRLKTAQARIRGGAATAESKTAPDPGTIYAAINRYHVEADFDPKKANKGGEDRRRKMKLFDRVQHIAEGRARERNRPLTGAEIDEIVRQQTITVNVRSPGFLGTRTQDLPAYLSDEVEGASGRTVDTSQIPATVRNEIVAEWRRAHGGEEPNAAQIWDVYRRR